MIPSTNTSCLKPQDDSGCFATAFQLAVLFMSMAGCSQGEISCLKALFLLLLSSAWSIGQDRNEN